MLAKVCSTFDPVFHYVHLQWKPLRYLCQIHLSGFKNSDGFNPQWKTIGHPSAILRKTHNPCIGCYGLMMKSTRVVLAWVLQSVSSSWAAVARGRGGGWRPVGGKRVARPARRTPHATVAARTRVRYLRSPLHAAPDRHMTLIELIATTSLLKFVRNCLTVIFWKTNRHNDVDKKGRTIWHIHLLILLWFVFQNIRARWKRYIPTGREHLC